MKLLNYIQKFQDGGLIKPKNISNEKWKEALSLYNSAMKSGDKFPELTLAQAILETGWFKSPAGKYNYFGQKATQGQKGSQKNTTEVFGGKSVKMSQKFRDYNTIDEAMSDRQRLWGSKYKNASTIEDALYSIWEYDPSKKQGKGYATDPQYDNKIKSILNTIGVNFNSKGRGFITQDNNTTEPPQKTQQQLPNYDYILASSVATIYDEYKDNPTALQQMLELKRAFDEKQTQEAQELVQQEQDYTHQLLLQEQAKKEQFLDLLVKTETPNEQYTQQMLNSSPQPPPAFQFSSDWFKPQVVKEGGCLQKIKQKLL